jgi:hypothetical protein
MKKTVWTFGLISGAIISLLMGVSMAFHDAIGFDKGEIVGYATMVLSFLLIFFGVRSYRDNVAGGRVGFGRAFVVGSLIALISSACYVATWELIFIKFSPDFSAKYAAHVIEKTRASGASQAAIDAKIVEMQKFQTMYQNPLINAAMTFMEPLPVGLVIALVSAGILRRKREEDASAGLARAIG